MAARTCEAWGLFVSPTEANANGHFLFACHTQQKAQLKTPRVAAEVNEQQIKSEDSRVLSNAASS